MCPCVCLKVNMSILCGLEKLLDHCRERDFIWQRISFFRIPKVSILENYQFLFAFDWPVYSCFFSVSRQRSLKFVCARVCVFVWLWCLLDSDLCFCFLFFTEQKQNNIVANMDMHCFKKKSASCKTWQRHHHQPSLFIYFEMCVKYRNATNLSYIDEYCLAECLNVCLVWGSNSDSPSWQNTCFVVIWRRRGKGGRGGGGALKNPKTVTSHFQLFCNRLKLIPIWTLSCHARFMLNASSVHTVALIWGLNVERNPQVCEAKESNRSFCG